MADVSITVGSVLPGADAVTKTGLAGETVTAGQVGYYDATTNRWLKADSNATGEVQRAAKGIFLNGAASGQPVTVQTGGLITVGGTLTPGVAYYLSDTPGGICPVADVGAGEYAVLLGMAKSAAVLNLDISYSGVSL